MGYVKFLAQNKFCYAGLGAKKGHRNIKLADTWDRNIIIYRKPYYFEKNNP